MKVGFIVDSLDDIDTSVYRMLNAAYDKNWSIFVFYSDDLNVFNGVVFGKAKKIKIHTNKSSGWYSIEKEKKISLYDLDTIFMQKKPPFNMDYIYITYMLDLVKKEGVLIVNNPQALRDYSEKVTIAYFPKYTPNILITKNHKEINNFYDKYKDIVIKPLGYIDGKSIFRIKEDDINKDMILETVTENQTKYVMVQDYQKAEPEGSKKVLIIAGEPIKYCTVKILDETIKQGNIFNYILEIKPLNENDNRIAQKVGKKLKNQGIIFAEIDILGDKLTGINITNPVSVQEIYNKTKINAASLLMQAVEEKIEKNKLNNK